MDIIKLKVKAEDLAVANASADKFLQILEIPSDAARQFMSNPY